MPSFYSATEISNLFMARVSCMVAGSDEINVVAIVCLGYPLKVLHKPNPFCFLLNSKLTILFSQENILYSSLDYNIYRE
jgi:hypothetical protein